MIFLFITFIFPAFLFAQNKDTDRYFKEQSQQNQYEKSKKFKGPDSWNSSYPKDLSDYYYDESQRFEQNLPIESTITTEDLNESRVNRYGSEYSDGAIKKPNPGIIPPNPVELPDIDIDLPDIDLPDIDLPDINMPSLGTWEFWKTVLLILTIGALLFILYLILKNIRPSNSKISVDVEDEWNPTVVTKSELELKLEKAVMGNDFRECVRIHFMFILKELITNNIIDWKPEKTNYDYVTEVRKSKGYDGFEECVRIYDLVWYGDYEIALQDYNRLKPALENYYQSLNPKE